MSIELTEILAAMINFGIFYAVLRVFFFKKISAVMDQRNQAIRENIDHAQADRREAERLVKEAHESARQNKVAGAEVISKYKEKAEEVYEDIVSDARAEAKLIVQRGTKNAERELEQSRRHMRESVVELATMLSKKAIGEDAREDTHDRLVDDIISKVGDA